MKKIIIFCALISSISYSQTNTAKNVIIINNNIRSITGTTAKMSINGVITPKLVYKSFVVQQHNADSIEIKIPYRNFFFKKREKKLHFAIKEKDNYFKYAYSGFMLPFPHIKQVTCKKLIRLKKRRYVRKKIAEFHLDE